MVSSDNLPAWCWVAFYSIVFGLLPAVIASKKGRSFWLWWGFGAVLPILALPLAIQLKPIEVEKKFYSSLKECPECRELIKQEAVKCKYCQHKFAPMTVRSFETEAPLKCPSCGVPIWRGYTRCPGCNQPIRACRNCNMLASPGDRHGRNCGTRL